MTQKPPNRHLRLVALVTATTALVLSATMSVSYARPFGAWGPYGGYGGYGATSVPDGR